MKKVQHNKPLRWRKIPKDRLYKAEDYLRANERFCVTASARFLSLRENRGHVWHLSGSEGDITALLLHCRSSLFPLFNKSRFIPGPRFLSRFLGKIHIHAIQGLREDTESLEVLMEKQGYHASERIDYDLMNIDNSPKPEALSAGPAGLVLRKAAAGDAEQLLALQSAYEQEEVLPRNAVFNPDACRLNLKNILSSEHLLVAELDGRVVGKINTSAESFTRYQIGGVYVRPDCRGLGIAVKMTAVFIQGLMARGKGISLFVKKRNTAARKVYGKAGLSVLADYRITYY